MEYNTSELDEAFKLIVPAGHWKNPIDTWIHPSKFDVCNAACIYYTGSVLKQVQAIGDGAIRVRADGYYLTIGA